MSNSLRKSLVRDLERIARDSQIASRTPGLVAGVARGSEVVWSTAIGVADLDGTDADDGAVTQVDDAVGPRRVPRVMRDEQDGGARVEQVYATEIDALRANQHNTDVTRKVRFLPYGIAVTALDD